MSKIVVIVGPTASGKSELALNIARAYNGAIVSADSMQIYRGLDIGTAKENKKNRDEIPHYMIDVVNKDDEFSVAEFKEMATKVITEIQNSGKLPIVVGGTGLYIEALLYPLSFGNANKNSIMRKQLESELEQNGREALYDKLKDIDQATAEKLHPNDTKRIIRALEIFYTTGKTMSETKDKEKKCAYDVVFVGLDCERKKLYERINLRVGEMFRSGLIDEIQALEKYPERFSWQSMQAIGYKEFAQFYEININQNETKKVSNKNNTNLNQSEAENKNTNTNTNTNTNIIANANKKTIKSAGADELEQIKDAIKKDTRNYAKRQLTWFRRYKNITWFDCTREREVALKFVENQLK